MWSKNKVLKHAQKFSQAFKKNNSPWQTNFEAMAKKTVLLDLLKYAPKSVELEQQLASDSTSVTDFSKDMTENMEYIDVSAEEEFVVNKETGEVKVAKEF